MVKIINFVNCVSEMNIGDVLALARDANLSDSRVDYVPQDALNRVARPIGTLSEDFFNDGVVVVWSGYTETQTDLAEAVVRAATEE